MKDKFKKPPSALDQEAFLALYGGVYEHSPHFAESTVVRQVQLSGALDSVAGLWPRPCKAMW